MRSQATRDDETLVIASALGLFLAVTAAGGLVVWLVDVVVGWPRGVVGFVFPVLEVVALVAALAVLVQHRRAHQ